LLSLNGYKLKVIFALSIIIPMGTLTTLKLAGFLAPAPIETVTLPTKQWTFQRPYPDKDVDILEKLEATYVNHEISLNITQEIIDFIPGLMSWTPPGDYLRFALFVDAAVDGCVQSVEILFCNDTHPSFVWIKKTSIELVNLTVAYCKETDETEGITHIMLAGTNKSNKIHFKAECFWFLCDSSPTAPTHQLQILYTITYHNGTALKKLTQPFQLTILKSEQP